MTAVGDYLAAATQPPPGGRAPVAWDELVGADGGLRPSWAALAPRLATLDADDLRRLAADVERRVADDGVVHPRAGAGDEPAVAEPWRLDPLPQVVAAEEWARLEVGLVQRAELLEAVLRDLYGPQRLLAEGVVPPEVVLGHPEFVRAAVDAGDGVDAPRRLVVGATDLARGPDGGWLVVGDRTQAPSGAGFAMQNRRVVARVLPELYREAGLLRLSPWFTALRRALEAAAPAGVAAPRVVVLSPGPQSETAFDQAFVARALGLPLVEGGDLVVRDGAVRLRALGGLERVDVLVRRVDTAWCDPLELRAGSRLGVPGLAEVARRGAVSIVNGLGSGVLENPGLVPFLPAACEVLLGEGLRLPAPPTWWCGDPTGRAHVLAHLDTLLVLPIAAADRAHERLGRDELARRVQAEPWAWVGQEPVDASWSPRVVDGALRRAPFGLRTFVVARGESYTVMPGGLGQVVDTDGGAASGVASKDVWVADERRDAVVGAGPDERRGEPLGASAAMVPRVLDDLFWLGRYAERAEDALRLLLAVHGVAEDARGGEAAAVAALEPLGEVIDVLIGPGPGATPADRMRALLVDRSRTGTVAHAVAALEDAARGVRDQLSGDVWTALGAVDRALETARRRRTAAVGTLAEDAERALSGLLALAGVTAENMVRDAGWRMLDAGRGLERAHQVVSLLRATLVAPGSPERDDVVATAVLAAAESTVTHRRRYRRGLGVAGVLDLLVTDADNPRSVTFSLRRADASLDAVPGTGPGSRPRRLLADVLEEVGRADPARLATVDERGRADLDRFLGAVGARLDEVGDAVAAHHFDADRAPRAFGEPGAAATR